MLTINCAECRYAGCHYADYRYAVCCNADCRYSERRGAKLLLSTQQAEVSHRQHHVRLHDRPGVNAINVFIHSKRQGQIS